MPENPLEYQVFDRTTLPRYWKAITAPSGALDPVPKAIWANAGVTITVMDASGNTEAFTLAQAGYVPCGEPRQVTVLSGGTVVGLYDANPH